MNETWIRTHFKAEIAKEPDKLYNPVYVSNWDIMRAIKKMGKNKA